MSGQHDPSKKLVTFWATEDEKSLLQSAAKAAGFRNLADYLRWIAQLQPKPGQLPNVSIAPKTAPGGKSKKRG